jgi:hypothetical protein
MMWSPHQIHGRTRTSIQHSWQGFSTGEWEGDMLKVTTTHLKEGWLRRNGVPRSERATLVEYFIRHGEYLTLVTIVKDPVYLTEPFVRTSNWVADPGFQLSPFSCVPTVEIERAARGAAQPAGRTISDRIRHQARPARPHVGAETMYPDYSSLRGRGVREGRHEAPDRGGGPGGDCHGPRRLAVLPPRQHLHARGPGGNTTVQIGRGRCWSTRSRRR